MSISSRIENMTTNISNAYDSLEKLGQTADNKNLENLSSLIDNIYDNLPKTEYQEGTEVNLGKTSKGKLDYDNGVVGIGQTEQDGEPTPDTPIPINSVTGNQDVVVSGINFFEAKMATDTSAGVTVTNNNDGTFTLNGTATGSTTFRLDQLSRNSQDNLKSYENGTYTLSMGNSKSGLGMAMMQIGTYTTFMYVGSGSSLVSRTLTNATSMFIYLDITSGTQFENFVVKPMLVKGTYTSETLPSFEPYITPTSYQLSLGEYKFYGIGDYADELLYDVENDKVYKNEKIGDKTLIGAETEYWAYSSGWSKTNTNVFYMSSVTPNALFDDYDEIYGLCNRFIVSSRNNVNSTDTNLMSYSGAIDLPQLTIRIDKTIANDLTAFIQWLSNNNLKYYYILETPTLTEITGTLKDQIKALYNAHSLNGTTIITSNGNLPMIIKVRGLKGE